MPSCESDSTSKPVQVPQKGGESVAVIGAGISGLIAARKLQDHGFEVTVFEKSRGPGGRAATRRIASGITFDHGAQYFTARDPQFISYVESGSARGIVAEWYGQFVEIRGGEVRTKSNQPRRFVGVPGMASIGRELASNLRICLETRILRLTRSGDSWELIDAAGHSHGPFHQVLVTLPAPQSAELLGTHPFAAEVQSIPMTPCWAVMAAWERRIEVDWDGAFVQDSALAWIARNSSKPGRGSEPDCWVLHASPEWSATHLETTSDEVAGLLLQAFAQAIGVPLPPASFLAAHRWRYSQGSDPTDRRVLYDRETGLLVCGDWLAGGRIEGAFLSGLRAAELLCEYSGSLSKPTRLL